MTVRDLNRAVAQATGESVDTIVRRGFSLLALEPREENLAERPPLTVDWDALDAQRCAAVA